MAAWRQFVPEALTSRVERVHTARMADKQGFYWDLDECGWVRSPQPVGTIDVPEQAGPETRAVEADQEADVRSG